MAYYNPRIPKTLIGKLRNKYSRLTIACHDGQKNRNEKTTAVFFRNVFY